MKYNKISGFSDEIDASIKIQFEAFGRLNIKYFEPRGIDGKNISELDDSEVLSLKEKMDKCGIKVSSIGSPIGKIKLTDVNGNPLADLALQVGDFVFAQLRKPCQIWSELYEYPVAFHAPHNARNRLPNLENSRVFLPRSR